MHPRRALLIAASHQADDQLSVAGAHEFWHRDNSLIEHAGLEGGRLTATWEIFCVVVRELLHDEHARGRFETPETIRAPDHGAHIDIGGRPQGEGLEHRRNEHIHTHIVPRGRKIDCQPQRSRGSRHSLAQSSTHQ